MSGKLYSILTKRFLPAFRDSQTTDIVGQTRATSVDVSIGLLFSATYLVTFTRYVILFYFSC